MIPKWARHPLEWLKAGKIRREVWHRLYPPGRISPLEALPLEIQGDAAQTADLVCAQHRRYLSEFNAITARARQTFENRAWTQGMQNAERRVRLYRDAVIETWRVIQRQWPERLGDRKFWMAARQVFLDRILSDYDADLALTFFYSTMRLAFDKEDAPVEYDDDGLAERSHFWGPREICRFHSASPERLSRSIENVLKGCGFRARFENIQRDAALVSARLLEEWGRKIGAGSPDQLQTLKPLFFRDREAYVAGKLRSPRAELPLVLALRHGDAGITVDAVLGGTQDMRNILFVSTRSTFHVFTPHYREVLGFLDTLAPERGHPAMAAVVGFTHPARVALNQALRRHLCDTGERFVPTPGRKGLAMIVFSPPSFPYVFKVVRDFSSKPGWTGRARIMELYRWVHEMNRGRLMLDAWLYRNLHFRRDAFDAPVLEDLLANAPGSVRLDGDTVVLKHVYAQRRVKPLNTFFEETRDRAERERAADSLGAFIKDLASMGFFPGDHYGLPFNTGLTHGANVVLFDFDDLGPLLRFRFRETPPMDEEGGLLWNTEADGAWFSLGEYDVLTDEWERYLGVPADLRDFFHRKHGELFTLAYWIEIQQRVSAGDLHYVVPYPPDRRLVR